MAAVNFLENGGELPEHAGSTARQRFVFMSAAMRRLYQVSKGADGKASEALAATVTLRDRIDQRTGLLAGSAVIGTAVGAMLLLAGKAFGLFWGPGAPRRR